MLDFRRRGAARINDAPQAVAEVRYTDLGEAERECDLFRRCADGAPRQFAERFMTAVSPGVIATILLERPLRLARALHAWRSPASCGRSTS